MHQVRYFLALCDTLNFTRAAEKCNVSQPSLTRAVKGLEDELGGPLFHRERNNTHLTELGRSVHPFLMQVAQQLERAKARARDYVKLEDAPLRLGVMHSIGPAKLIALMEQYRAGNPGVEIHLLDASAGALQDKLDQGDLDVAILARPDAIDDRFHSMKLFEERFVVGIAPTHRLANAQVIRCQDLEGERYLSRTNCEFGESTARLFDCVALDRPYRSGRDDWVQAMALAGLGFCLMPEHAITLPGLVTRPLEPELKRTVNVLTVRGRPHAPVVGAFMRQAMKFRSI